MARQISARLENSPDLQTKQYIPIPPQSQSIQQFYSVMRWSPSSSKNPDEKKPEKWSDTLNATDWTHYTNPHNVIPVILLTTTILGSYSFYRSYLRRIPQATLIQPNFWRKRSLFGRVTKVGDGDGFRLFHMPGGRLAGWEWLPWRRVPKGRAGLKDKTVRVMLVQFGHGEG